MASVSDSDETEPEARHRACWYGRRTPQMPAALTVQTIEDGEILFCAHPMMYPVVGHDFDIRNCSGCDLFRLRHSRRP
jgi:hypothetical protein